MKASKIVMTLVAVIAVVTVAAGPASARRGSVREKEKAELQSSGVDDDASGLAKLKVKGGIDGQLDVKVKKLDRKAVYEVLADGVHVGSITTNRGGNGSIRFRSRPKSSKDELLGFDPRGAVIAIRNANGDEILRVTLTDSTPADPGDIVCCIPDDSGAECEDRTPAECIAQGGTATAATSCLPNPCADVPPGPGADVVCCLPDDSAPECEDRTAAECSAQGGVVVEALSCTPNPCMPVATPEDDIQCCLPDDSGPKCEDRTSAECAAQGGTDMGPGTCTPNPCA